MYQNIPTKVLTGEVRLSYANLTAPRAPQQGGEAKYSVAKAHEEYEKQLETDQSAAEQAIAKTKGQAKANAGLVDSLRTLIDANDDAGSNNEAIAQTVDQLNMSVEGLGLAYDKTTGKLSASIDEVEKYVDAQGELSVIKAQEDEYNRLLGEQLDLQAKIRVEEERKKVLAKPLEDGIITQREYNDLIKRTDDLLADYGETEQRIASDVQIAHAAIDRSARDSAQAQVNAFDAVNGALDAEGRNLKQLALQYGIISSGAVPEHHHGDNRLLPPEGAEKAGRTGGGARGGEEKGVAAGAEPEYGKRQAVLRLRHGNQEGETQRGGGGGS